MEENSRKTLKDFVIPFALIAGVSRIIIDYIPKVADASPIFYYSTFVICFIAEIFLIRFVIKKFRAFNKGELSFKQGLLIGVTIMAIVGSIYGVSAYVYDSFLDPNFQINTMIKWGKMWGPEAEEAIMQQLQDNPPKPQVLGIFYTILWFSFVGTVISVIMASIFKSPKN